MKKYILSLLLATTVVFYATAQIETILTYDRYHTHSEVNQFIQDISKKYPKLTKTVLVGKTEEGREIWALEINNPETGEADDKPAVYLDANIHGNEIQGSEVVMYFAEYLLGNNGKLDKITDQFNRNAYYMIPVVNADGRSHFMSDGNTSSSNRSIRIAKDDDRDGKFDEDGYDDLDNDGSIVKMRIKDPNGKWTTDKEDPRIMVRAAKGEKGEYTMLGSEGIDNDNDGKLNEDNEGYLDPNRVWGFDWKPDYIQRGAGLYPLSGVGLKAIAEYLRTKPNIMVVDAFHNAGGLLLRGPGNRDQEPLPAEDIAVYNYIGSNGEKILPGYTHTTSVDGLYPTYGDFKNYGYNILGAYSYVVELYIRGSETYSGSKDKNKKLSRVEQERERLKFNDNVAHGYLFKEWEKYDHPQYGEVELGGWIKYSSRLEHPFMLMDMIHRNASQVLFSGNQTPLVNMDIINKKSIGKGLTQIDVCLKNSNAMPTLTMHSVKKKLFVFDNLSISGVEVVAGGEITDLANQKVKFKEFQPESHFFYIPGESVRYFRYIVKGSGNATLNYKATKAKDITKKIKI